jgi:hypothetical protein
VSPPYVDVIDPVESNQPFDPSGGGVSSVTSGEAAPAETERPPTTATSVKMVKANEAQRAKRFGNRISPS